MKFPTGLLQAIAAAANLNGRKTHTRAPAHDPIGKELMGRMEEFLHRDLFSLAMQPVVSLDSGCISTGEVLTRLNHPERGMVFPDQFLPVIDNLGLHPRFDRHIFEKSCAWVSRALAAGEPVDCISINFSRTTLCGENLADDLIAIADRYGVPHCMLGVEITEQVAETGVVRQLENLNRLKCAGFRIILDDCGSGVTSFNDLMHYPLDVLKLDHSLLRKAETREGAKAFRGLVAMATELGAQVVCEGIETPAQHRFAREAGCHYGQGYLYFRPTAQDQFFHALRTARTPEVCL